MLYWNMELVHPHMLNKYDMVKSSRLPGKYRGMQWAAKYWLIVDWYYMLMGKNSGAEPLQVSSSFLAKLTPSNCWANMGQQILIKNRILKV